MQGQSALDSEGGRYFVLNGTMHTIAAATGAVLASVEADVNEIQFDPASQSLIGLTTRTGTQELVRVNPQTGAISSIGFVPSLLGTNQDLQCQLRCRDRPILRRRNRHRLRRASLLALRDDCHRTGESSGLSSGGLRNTVRPRLGYPRRAVVQDGSGGTGANRPRDGSGDLVGLIPEVQSSTREKPHSTPRRGSTRSLGTTEAPQGSTSSVSHQQRSSPRLLTSDSATCSSCHHPTRRWRVPGVVESPSAPRTHQGHVPNEEMDSLDRRRLHRPFRTHQRFRARAPHSPRQAPAAADPPLPSARALSTAGGAGVLGVGPSPERAAEASRSRHEPRDLRASSARDPRPCAEFVWIDHGQIGRVPRAIAAARAVGLHGAPRLHHHLHRRRSVRRTGPGELQDRDAVPVTVTESDVRGTRSTPNRSRAARNSARAASRSISSSRVVAAWRLSECTREDRPHSGPTARHLFERPMDHLTVPPVDEFGEEPICEGIPRLPTHALGRKRAHATHASAARGTSPRCSGRRRSTFRAASRSAVVRTRDICSLRRASTS